MTNRTSKHMGSSLNRKGTFFIALTFFIVQFLFAAAEVESAVPNLVNYQGKLTGANNEEVQDGTYGIEFRIWTKKISTDVGDKLIWGKKYSIVLVGGHFNVILGAPGGSPCENCTGAEEEDIGAAFGGSERFLGITVVNKLDVEVPDPTEISPRQQILSTPYALHSDNTVPVGTIIAFHTFNGKANYSKEWQICNGDPITDPESPLVGEDTPNLVDRFLRGSATSGTPGGDTPSTGNWNGGADLNAHKHELPFGIDSYDVPGEYFPDGTVHILEFGGNPFGTGSTYSWQGASAGGVQVGWMQPLPGISIESELSNTPNIDLNNHTHSIDPNSIIPHYTVIYIVRIK